MNCCDRSLELLQIRNKSVASRWQGHSLISSPEEYRTQPVVETVRLPICGIYSSGWVPRRAHIAEEFRKYACGGYSTQGVRVRGGWAGGRNKD